jgi:hypothetical protein
MDFDVKKETNIIPAFKFVPEHMILDFIKVRAFEIQSNKEQEYKLIIDVRDIIIPKTFRRVL